MADSVFPWTADLAPERLSAFVDDLWGATAAENEHDALAALDKVVAQYAPAPAPKPECPLTERQVELITHLANGLTYGQAAEAMGSSLDTIKRHAENAYVRLGVSTKAPAIALAVHHQWLPGLHVPPLGPSKTNLGPAHWDAVHAKAAADMRATPGAEVAIGPYVSHTGATTVVGVINKGLRTHFQPAGSFEARRVRSDLGWDVVARFVGTAQDQEGRADA
ncbi:response regulator transcription factor [Streptomyces sp. NPDC005227]|uniref:response regulator transcription factor n=1 Tax=Streptomyces sp. NPDC005227 TaxID=3364707 RepID=UPI00368571C5